MGFSQTTIVFAALLVAFVIFITTRGELSKYLAVLFGYNNSTGLGTASTSLNSALSQGQSALNSVFGSSK